MLKEYLTLDHAELVPQYDLENPPKYVFYLPTCGVFKDSSTTTKLHAIFDASANSSSGTSLNDLLLTGPNLYPLLTTILVKFSLHRIAFSADINKMFRGIALQPQDRDLHRFLLHDDQGQIRDYRMKRLTFGVKPSPFLATKVLHHLAEFNKDTHPLASHSILTSFYVDDFLLGASTLQEADKIRQELCRLLKSARMILRKWQSNDLSFLETIPEDLRELADLHLPSPLSASKTLGIHWDVSKDNFYVSVPFVNDDLPVTKREIASISAKVFDIMGFYSPATVPSKILLQELWKLNLSWDDPEIKFPKNGSSGFQHYQLSLLIRFHGDLYYRMFRLVTSFFTAFQMPLLPPMMLWCILELRTKMKLYQSHL